MKVVWLYLENKNNGFTKKVSQFYRKMWIYKFLFQNVSCMNVRIRKIRIISRHMIFVSYVKKFKVFNLLIFPILSLKLNKPLLDYVHLEN